MSTSRPSWRDYLLTVASEVAKRATCPRASVGCVIALDHRILSTGYNGSPPGQDHCIDVGCDVRGGHCVRTVHAEANAVATAARMGVSVNGATAYITHTPCRNCQNLLASAGIHTTYFGVEYP